MFSGCLFVSAIREIYWDLKAEEKPKYIKLDSRGGAKKQKVGN